MLRGACFSCYRFYRASSAASTPPPTNVSSSCDGRRCVARSSTTVTVPKTGCNGGCRPPPPTAAQTVAAASSIVAAAATAAVAAEFEQRRRGLKGGITRNVARLEGAAMGQQSRRSPPPLFGANVPLLGSASVVASVDKRTLYTDSDAAAGGVLKPDPDDKDCPICRKYGQGPCGELFKQWLKCTDKNAGKDQKTGEELHLSACENLAAPLARCLEGNDDYYSRPLHEESQEAAAAADDNGGTSDAGRQLQRAWSGLVDYLESKKEGPRRTSFPDTIQPEMEVRYQSMAGMAAFAPENESGDALILAYIKDQDGELLGAGSSEDVRSGGGIMRFGVRDDTKSVTACAMYGGGNGVRIYTRTEVLLLREDDK